jgi:acetyl-CoA carboxylase biotin carboxyl carrier protein
VADAGSKSSGPFDLQTIKNLVALMSRHDLSEIDLREGTRHLRLRRGPRPLGDTMPAVPLPPVSAPAVSLAPVASALEPPRPAKILVEIKSPTPGTFYSAPNPGADPYVHVGTRVNPTTVVGLIEAMKLFNEIPADCSGVIAEVVVENGQPVEFGQVLFRVDPT